MHTCETNFSVYVTDFSLKLGLPHKLLKLRHKKGAEIAKNYLVVTAPIIAFL